MDWLWSFLEEYKSRNPEKFNLFPKQISVLDSLGAKPSFFMDNYSKNNFMDNFIDNFPSNHINSGRLMMEKPIRGLSRSKHRVIKNNIYLN